VAPLPSQVGIFQVPTGAPGPMINLNVADFRFANSFASVVQELEDDINIMSLKLLWNSD
jgi:hypothetical protein